MKANRKFILKPRRAEVCPRQGRRRRAGAVSLWAPPTPANSDPGGLKKGSVSRGSASEALRVVDDLLWQMEATGPLCSCPPPPRLSLVCSLSQHSASAPVSLPRPAFETVRGHHRPCARARVPLASGPVRAFVGLPLRLRVWSDPLAASCNTIFFTLRLTPGIFVCPGASAIVPAHHKRCAYPPALSERSRWLLRVVACTPVRFD